jgi:hypothetical protein
MIITRSNIESQCNIYTACIEIPAPKQLNGEFMMNFSYDKLLEALAGFFILAAKIIDYLKDRKKK